MADAQEERENEMLALASIYDEDVFRQADSGDRGEVHLCLDLPPNFKLVFQGVEQTEHDVSFLPPLKLEFALPEDYPSSSPPIFTLKSKWLTRIQLSALCKRLDELWEENEGCVVLFTWIQFLKEETLDFLEIQSPLLVGTHSSNKTQHDLAKTTTTTSTAATTSQEGVTAPGEASSAAPHLVDPRAVLDLDHKHDLAAQLLDFNEEQWLKVFNGKMLNCGICFTEKLGGDCLYFKICNHVYCNECMAEYFTIQIRDGNVQCLSCPEPKCTSVATPEQVKKLVGEAEFARYDRLLLQSSLDGMPDVVYCPRSVCRAAVMLEPETKLAICPACQFAFCHLCNRGYHGVSACKAKFEELLAMREEYINASPAEKAFMEQRYGKHVLQRVVEESYSSQWLKENCKNCPLCGTNIQKIDGCNKMTCSSCKQYFCWLCLGSLSKADPYSHFNNQASPCFNQLFQGVDVEDDFWDDEDDPMFI
ncbi:E3 ubiquitin-protein ligase RNF14 [Engraulis encrasicolus]|uniref:E3 ubiquitin-protein ligase RNF14 n=1 Tax=Engraulis encrasicolus TaxID=184585 RepID=UPI002FD15D31